MTRTQHDSLLHDTAQPSLTSGFGAVIEKERELRMTTENALGQHQGDPASGLDRLLVHQHAALGGAIALLEQRYEALPKPERFVHWHGGSQPHPVPPPTGDLNTILAALIAQHTELRANIAALIACDPDGQRGELILTEVGRHHDEMARALAEVLALAAVPTPSGPGARDVSGITHRAQERWDNEGGPARE